MRRILSVMAAAALMAALVVATAVPAFANPSGEKDRCSKFSTLSILDCRGGSGSGGGGSGGGSGSNSTLDFSVPTLSSRGGGGSGGSGGGGSNCFATGTGSIPDCHRKGFPGP